MDKAINNLPLISVLLPVYNSALYLREAIDSILTQSYPHFELLIINDGSTDESESIIKSYQDIRINYFKNDGNQGLIYTLNKGISLAKGAYIARMDGDDIALPKRLEIQLAHFNTNPDASLICSPIIPIHASGELAKAWAADVENKTSQQIRQALIHENCIAHPSVLIKTEVAKKYQYNSKQKGSEDWDLWMRLSADGHKIVKTEMPLLKYRFLSTGITMSDNKQQSVELKSIKVKFKFLLGQISKLKINGYTCQVAYSLLRSGARHIKINRLPPVLRSIKRWTSIPFTKAGSQLKLLEAFYKPPLQFDLIFFFPYCHIGGAERVHANIVSIYKGKKVAVFFTGISHKSDFFFLFENSAPAFNIGFCLNHPFYEKKTKKIIFSIIESNHKATFFGCNNLFFDEATNKYAPNFRFIDLTHDYVYTPPHINSYEDVNLFFKCEKRIFISEKAIEQTKLCYAAESAPQMAYNKLTLITNYVAIPEAIPIKDYNGALKVLYVGRGSAEKRAHLFGALAKRVTNTNTSITFTGIGNLKEVIQSEDVKSVQLTGELNHFSEVEKYYNTHHIIVITSIREGFPMAIMEGMAHGMMVLSTGVGDVNKHVSSDIGFITSQIEAATVINEMAEMILKIDADRTLLKSMSLAAYNYAQQHFSQQAFETAYKKTIGF